MIRDDLTTATRAAIMACFGLALADIELTLPQPGFGDYSTNVAFSLAKQVGKSPREIAQLLAGVIVSPLVAKVEAAGAGYINFYLSDAAIIELAVAAPGYHPVAYANQVVATEYSDPNPFKVLHVGHFYTTVIGDAISNLVRLAGGDVHAVNFGGDVGLHVGKTLWAIITDLGGEYPDKLADIKLEDQLEWIASCYVAGSAAYDEDEAAKVRIQELNRTVYAIHEADDHTSPLAQIYWTCREWSYDRFKAFYARIGTTFERYYPESETAGVGLATVKAQLEHGVYAKSDGAVVFNGEPFGLHTRVFITSQGLPTYETKDVGVLMAKWRDYHFDRSIVITGNDILDYMKVVLKSVEQFAPELAEHSTHITHGNVKLAGGAKMSSRKGNFLRATDVLDITAAANKAANGQDQADVVLGAIKYTFLKQRIGADITFVPEESVSLEGNSGPYLQYAHARARSILAKATVSPAKHLKSLTADERTLAAKIGEYAAVLDRSVGELLPHYIATYLYELAQTFNRFYEANRVIGDEREAERLVLVALYADTLKRSLELMGMTAPEKM